MSCYTFGISDISAKNLLQTDKEFKFRTKIPVLFQDNQEFLYHNKDSKIKLDAYLEEELYDLITFCIQNSTASDDSIKEKRIKEIGNELFADGGVDALENMYFSIEHRIKEEISKNAKPYRSLWNGISKEWNY